MVATVLLVDARQPDSEVMQRMGAALRAGELVAFPTETVYGLGADALNSAAVSKIFTVKNRPYFDPLIVHVDDKKKLEAICYLNEQAKKLMELFMPGALTLVLRKKKIIPSIVTAGLPTVAVRMPAHPVAKKIIKRANTPVAAPSANEFGYLSPTAAKHVDEQLGKKIDLIIDGGPCKLGIESTIIGFEDSKPVLLRYGGIPVEEIENAVGKISIKNFSEKPSAPGQLPWHYSPRTKIKIFSERIPVGKNEKAGYLFFRKPNQMPKSSAIKILSAEGNLTEAASRLFDCLHKLDKKNPDIIYAEAVPEKGVGRAIMDRLKKASKR